MKELKVCFVGIGSIAKRHIKNLKRICVEENIKIEIDAIRRSAKKDTDDFFSQINRIFKSIEDTKTIYDIIFITNPTECHLETLKKVTPYGKNFFIEKPIVSLSQMDEITKYSLKEDSVYYVACPLRYNAVIQYIKGNISTEDIISVRSISSSYLPDWRPGQDYRNTYSAHKSLGGGVSIDLIHEWDYLTYLLGMPQKILCMIGKKSRLEIDSDDYAIYLAEYQDKVVELHLDYFGRHTIREITIVTDNDTIKGDLVNNRIEYLKSGKIVTFNEVRDDYQIRELEHFMNLIKNKIKSDNDINHAIEVLKLTQGRV